MPISTPIVPAPAMNTSSPWTDARAAGVVYRNGERLDQRGDLHINVVIELDQAVGVYQHILGEHAIHRGTHDLNVGTQVLAALVAAHAGVAGLDGVGADLVADLDVGALRVNSVNLAAGLMTHHKGRLGGRVLARENM